MRLRDNGFTNKMHSEAGSQSMFDVTVTPLSMYDLIGNLDGLVMWIDPNSPFSLTLIADVSYSDPNKGVIAEYSAVCYDAGKQDNALQVIMGEYLLNTIQYAMSICETKYTISLGDYKRFSLKIKLDEYLSCQSVEFGSVKVVLNQDGSREFGESFAGEFSAMHGVEMSYDAIYAASSLCSMSISGPLLAFKMVSRGNPRLWIKGVNKGAPIIDESGVVLSQNYVVDVYYDLQAFDKEVVCLVYDKQSTLTYATSLSNRMVRIYVNKENAKNAECARWGDSLDLHISGMSDREYMRESMGAINKLRNK